MDIPTMALIVQTCGVVGTLIAATVGVTSYVNSNKRSEESRRKEQETQSLALKAQQHNLETRQAQLFMGLYQSLYSRDFTEAEFLMWKVKLRNVKEMERLMKDNVENYRAWNMYATFYEGLGVLVRENLIDVRLPAQLMSGMIVQFWENYRGVILDCRRAWGWPRFLVEVEYLAGAVVKYGGEHPELGIAAPKAEVNDNG
jgi:hypothetical protein